MAFPANIEQWRIINDYDNYEVSSHGRVRNNQTGKILKTRINNNGYNDLHLSKDGKAKRYTIHRLVCFAFCVNPNNYDIVDHIDRNKTNNMFNNLRWCTTSENNRNTIISRFNTSGIKGVYKSINRWYARWCDNDHKSCSKSFSIKTYGDEEAKTLAIAFRKAKEIELGYM